MPPLSRGADDCSADLFWTHLFLPQAEESLRCLLVWLLQEEVRRAREEATQGVEAARKECARVESEARAREAEAEERCRRRC